MSEAGTPRDHQAGNAFAHASEAEFARILDFYQVAWEYEPQVFPILWDLDGNVLESFAPDFFLPDLELFVELTTLQQRLVRRRTARSAACASSIRACGSSCSTPVTSGP